MARQIWVSWAKVVRTTEEGSLGVWHLQEMIDAMSVKLWWKFRTQEASWISFFPLKYYKRAHPCQVVDTSVALPVLLRLLAARELGEDSIRVVISRGGIPFFLENWMP